MRKFKFYTDCVYGIRVPNCSKLTMIQKNDNAVTNLWHNVIAKLFWRCFVSLVKFSYWFKFLSGYYNGLEIPNLAQLSLIKSHKMLQTARVTAFAVSELLRQNQQGVKHLSPPDTHTQTHTHIDTLRLEITIFPNCCKISRLYLVLIPNCWTWIKITPQINVLIGQIIIKLRFP